MSTAYGDPNSNVSYSWVDADGSDYARVNDAVRDPTNAATGGDGLLCRAGELDDLETISFGCSEPSISGTVTQVVVKVYADADTANLTNNELGAYYNSTTQATSTFTAVAGSPAWFTKTYSGLSIAAGSLFPWRVNIKSTSIGKSNALRVYAAYLEVTYTPSGGGGVTPDPVILELHVISPSLSDVISPNPVALDLAVVASMLSTIVSASPVALDLDVIEPQLIATMSGAPAVIELYAIEGSVAGSQQVLTADPVPLDLAVVTPALQTRIRPAPVLMDLYVGVPAAPSINVSPSPVPLELAVVLGVVSFSVSPSPVPLELYVIQPDVGPQAALYSSVRIEPTYFTGVEVRPTYESHVRCAPGG